MLCQNHPQKWKKYLPLSLLLLFELLYELDRMRIKNNSTAIGSVDPKIIARGYLSKAGYSSKSVDSIAGLLKKADENSTEIKNEINYNNLWKKVQEWG